MKRNERDRQERIKWRAGMAKERHAPGNASERRDRAQLVVFDAIMTAIRDGRARGLTGQMEARYADVVASKAADEIAELWERD